MSSTALYHRVMYYHVSQKECDFYESQRIIKNYENGNYDELSSMLYMDINNLIDYAGSSEFDLISESTFEIIS
ncbi:hypothetical protein PAF15_00935 [Weissella koreensis]|uniref:hypothetical protein n=1 Tax=Weissella koreensis TaxID=165096 RepID=UPI001FA792A9|nr:hypothetical protein [Weissella koreensis]MCZ9310543.1 hypothetical protein [Weissella koreensis]